MGLGNAESSQGGEAKQSRIGKKQRDQGKGKEEEKGKEQAKKIGASQGRSWLRSRTVEGKGGSPASRP